MKKRDLDHALQAAGKITGQKQFVIVGSQSLRGKYPDVADAIVHPAERLEGSLGQSAARRHRRRPMLEIKDVLKASARLNLNLSPVPSLPRPRKRRRARGP
jgi:hypothetical protein